MGCWIGLFLDMSQRVYGLSGANVWEQVYYQQHLGNPNNKKIKAPLVEPFEIPILLDRHVLAISAFYAAAPPRWRTAGYLTQTLGNINLGQSDGIGSPSGAIDASNVRISLNTTQLVIFPKLSSNDYYLWFDPVPWLPNLTFGVWQFVGSMDDEAMTLIQTVKIDVLRLESKVDSLSQGN